MLAELKPNMTRDKADLLALFSVEPGHTQALDWFIGSCLCEAEIWPSPRTSDGINGIERVLQRGPDALRVSGRIWEINQRLHEFWLELQRDGAENRFTWTLYFDVIERTPRRARDALNSHERPDEIEWSAVVSGEASEQDNALVIISGSVRVSLRDQPESEPPNGDDQTRRRRGH